MGIGVIARDITEMKKLVRDRERLVAIEYANQELEAFGYAVSHDLRSPLRSVQTIVEWLREDLGEALPEASVKHMNLLTKRVQRMEALLEGLWQYARIGRINIAAEGIDVGTLLRDTVEFLSPPTGITISIPNNMPRLKAPRAALLQVFSNLIGNAIKHHDRPADGRIDISWSDQGDRYEFAVSDDGPGIPAKFHQCIFNIFETVHSRDKEEGSGIGLALVKKNVQIAGGEVRVESGVPTPRGTTFRFTWPKIWPERPL